MQHRPIRSSGKIFAAGVVAVAVVATAYIFRVQIIDTERKLARGPIPEAVGHETFATEPAAAEAPAKPTSKPVTKPAVPVIMKPDAPTAIITAPAVTVAEQINLKVPFIAQAPTSNWDAVHEETCEEASALMVQAYLNNVPAVSAADAETKLQDLVTYERKVFGYFEDTTAAETAQFMRDHLGIKAAKVVEPKSMDEVRNFLRRGIPVIMPAAGKLLYNPNFKNGGPIYHMVVIKGFRKDGSFITNDAGTRNGADYIYSETVLWKAMSDWDQTTHLPSGVKRVIVVE